MSGSRSLLRALRHKTFALLWSGQTVSGLGVRLFDVALAWWVLEKTGSAAIMGTILLFSRVPMLVLLLVAGTVVDRVPRLRLMLICHLVRGLAISVMAVLAFSNLLEIWHVCLVSLVSGSAMAFSIPGYQALVLEVTPREDLTSANALASLGLHVGGIGGPAVGATVVSLLGSPFAFAMNGACFFIAGLCLLPTLQRATSPRPDGAAGNLIRETREGLRTVMASPWLWVSVGVGGLSYMTRAASMEVGLPFLIGDHLRAGVDVLGSFGSLMSLGSLLGVIWLGRDVGIRRRAIKFYGAWIAMGALIPVLGLPIGVPGVLTVAFAMGLFAVIASLTWASMRQEYVPGHPRSQFARPGRSWPQAWRQLWPRWFPPRRLPPPLRPPRGIPVCSSPRLSLTSAA